MAGKPAKAKGHAPRLEPLEPRLLLDAGPVISEFMAINSSGLKDQFGDDSDWIEIYNPAAAPIDLTGWYLTDKASNLQKWRFPDGTTLGAGEYLVVFASDQNTVINGEIHTNFKLDGDPGEYLALVRPDGVTVAYEYAPEFPPQEPDYSYGIHETVVTTVLVDEGAAARAIIPTEIVPGAGWTVVGYNDSGWPIFGATALGYEAVPAPLGSGSFYYAPYGPGGTYNLYEVVTTTKTFLDAYNDAKGRSQGSMNGHLVTIGSAAENEFIRSIIGAAAWIGLTDSTSSTFSSLGTYEAGNTSGNPLPPAGETPEPGERGYGFAWVDNRISGSEPFTYQNWASGQPNATTDDEDAVEISNTTGLWSDSKSGEGSDTTVKRRFVVEYEMPRRFFYGPFGPGGTWNLYELVSGSRTWIAAYNNALIRTQGGVQGHLVTIGSAAENAFIRTLIGTTAWIGLTDSATFAALGATEAGNTGGLPLPPAGEVPEPGERGYGFVWINGEPFTYQNWYTATGANQPDDASPGQDGAEITTGGVWYDNKNGEGDQTGTTRSAYVAEYEGVSIPLGFTVREVRSLGTLTSISQAVSLLEDEPGTSYAAPVINFADPQNVGGGKFGGNIPFLGGDPAADDNNFALRATATIKIPAGVAPGNQWTFLVNSDDGFRLRIIGAAFTQVSGTNTTINGDTMEHAGTRGSADSLGVVTLPPGEYQIELTHFDGTGSSSLELAAAPGSYTAVPTSNSPFRLVGDVLCGGLAVRDIGDQVATSLAAMKGVNASAYVRIPFTVEPGLAIDRLTLQMKYDDGFVAYLNGVEVARANAPASPAWNSAATAVRPYYQAVTYQEFNLLQYRSLLTTGTNVLAIHALNSSAGDAELLILPRLEATTVLATDIRYFSEASPRRPNTEGVLAFVADTSFSHDRGFYTGSFDLTITTPTPGAAIRYTTDGSPPAAATGTLYTGPIHIDQTTVLRAAAFRTEWEPSNVDTQTYLFLADIIGQSPTGQAPGPGWPTAAVNGQVFDYGMDPDVVNDPRYRELLDDALLAIPSISLVTDLTNLFDSAIGIYVNADKEGRLWERPVSVELINPDGTAGFQIDAGLRIRGGYSRQDANPKHALRLFFRPEYGASRLEFPLFGDEGADEFECIDLRTSQNYSWSLGGDSRNIMVRDVFNRDTQRDMGEPYTRSRFYHIYIDGQYWGLYMTEERPEASFGETYFEGDKDDYDVIKVGGKVHSNTVTDGNDEAYRRLWTAYLAGFASDEAYYRIQGLGPDGTRNPAYEVQVDVDNLIDYMISIYWSGDLDAPISNFLSNKQPNNYYAIRNRSGDQGWIFIRHDGEHTLRYDAGELYRDRTGPFTDPQLDQFQYFNPQSLHQKLIAHPDYKQRFADRVHKWMFNGGALTTEAATERFLARITQIELAIIAESARWGDSKSTVPKTKDDDWLVTVNGVLDIYMVQRPDIVLAQLKARGWYPDLAAPTFNQHGGTIPSQAPFFSLAMTAPAGTIYYTLDGSDPRLRGGARSPDAIPYAGPVALTRSTHVMARVLVDDGQGNLTWSALDEATFVVDTPPQVRITELMYHPAPPGESESPDLYAEDDFQFLELQNISGHTLNLAGLRLADGVDFTFPALDLAAGQRVLVVANPDAFALRYPAFTGQIAGRFTGYLAHSGERIVLDAGLDGIVQDFKFKDGWYDHTDGEGFSITVRNASQDLTLWSDFDGWRPSAALGGSPGQADTDHNPGAVVINEVMAHTDADPPAGLGDWVELANTTAAPIDVSGWYLSDDPDNLTKFRIPDGTPPIPAGGCAVFSQRYHFGSALAFSELGDTVLLTSAAPGGGPGGYRESETFGATDREVTLGRFIKSTGGKDFVAMISPTPGGANTGPLIGPIVFSEVMYNPATGHEFVELLNVTDLPVNLFRPAGGGYPAIPWRFVEGLGLGGAWYDLPADAVIPAHGYALVVPIDPAVFRATYNVPAQVPIFGPYPGWLANDGEDVELARPGDPEPDGTVPYYRVDRLKYNDNDPWPVRADGGGSSLIRLHPDQYGNDAGNWGPGTTGGSPGAPNVPLDATPPTVPGNLTAAAVTTTRADLAWTASADPQSGLAEYRVYRNGLHIATVTATAFSDTYVKPAITYTYEVTAVNRDDGESTPAAAPNPVHIVLLSSAAAVTATTVRVVFPEAMLRTSAETPGHYAVTYGSGQSIAVAAAALADDNVTVTLTLASPMVFDTLYTLTVNDVVTPAGFTIWPNSQKTFRYALLGSGTILREWWTGITGNTIPGLTGSPDYPDNPAGRNELTIFEAPTNWADNYGTRIRGYVTAPMTGTYYFFIASDDYSELYLNAAGEDPAGKALIASVAGSTGSREWTKYASQKSAAITLAAGQRYYIEALQKEGTGSDNLAVGWQLPDSTYERPIPATRISPFFPDPADMTVTVAATDAAAAETGADQASFTFTRTGNLTPALTVYYSLGGTADIADYLEVLTGTVTFASGQAVATITVTPVDDLEHEPAESLVLTLLGGHPTYALGAAAEAAAAIADNELPVVTAVRLGGRTDRGPSAIDPSGGGIRTIAIIFNEPVTFADADVLVQAVAFPGGVEQVLATPARGLAGSGTAAMTISLAEGAAVDTWLKITLSGSGTLQDAHGWRLDGEARGGAPYIARAADHLPTGNGAAGGDAAFYVGSLRGDFTGDLAVTAADKAGFAQAWLQRSPDADFRGVGFGPRPPDGRITLADIDGFTCVYQAAVAEGRRLDPLPAPGGQAAGVTELPALAPLAAQAPPAAPSQEHAAAQNPSAAEVDILAEAAGLITPWPAGSHASGGNAPAFTMSNAGWGDAPADDSPDDDLLLLAPLDPSADTAPAVLRI